MVKETNKEEKKKLRKRIQGEENYYLEMKEGDEVHITTTEGYIVLSLTMKKDGVLHKWGDHTEKPPKVI